MLKLIKTYYTILSFVSPKMAANSAFNIFQKVRKKSIRERERPFFEKARYYSLKHDKENLDCYEFGSEHQDLVVLVHGWDSNSGCMLGFIDDLVAQQKKVIAFNLPAHAFYKSKKTNYLECKNAFKMVVNQLPKHDSLSFISHSFGSGIVAFGLSEMDIKVDKLVFLTSPNYVIDIFKEFKDIISLGDQAFELMNNKASKLLNENIKDVATEQKLTLAKFNELLLIHDKNDKVIPYSNTININKSIPNSKIENFKNIGHYRMLWHKDVIKLAVDFVS